MMSMCYNLDLSFGILYYPAHFLFVEPHFDWSLVWIVRANRNRPIGLQSHKRAAASRVMVALFVNQHSRTDCHTEKEKTNPTIICVYISVKTQQEKRLLCFAPAKDN